MDIFKWNKYFTTGEKSIDEQHQKLVELLNDFGSFIADNKDQDNTDIKLNKILSELTEYTIYHFREEELFMTRHGIDKRHFSSHVYKHQYFITEISSVIKKDKVQYSDLLELFDYLVSWLSYHILGVDQEMILQYEKIKGGMTPKEAYDDSQNSFKDKTDVLVESLKNMVNQLLNKNRKLTLQNEELQKIVSKK